MTSSEIAAIVARQLVAESRYLGARAANPRIRAMCRLILEEAERDLAAAAAEVLRDRAPPASGRPADASGFPDDQVVEASR